MLVTVAGGASDAYEAFTSIVSTSEINIPFQKPSTSIWIMNDGSVDIYAAFHNNSALNSAITDTLNVATLDTSKFITAGTWVYNGANPWFGWQTSQAGASMQYDPGSPVVTQIGFTSANGSSCGIMGIQVSPDDGTTWYSPSASQVTGVTRSDGATGTGMDAVDLMSVAGVTYSFPYPAAWRMKFTETNTKNASATGYTINLKTATYKAGNKVFTVKAGESWPFPVASSQIRLASSSGNQPVRIWVYQ